MDDISATLDIVLLGDAGCGKSTYISSVASARSLAAEPPSSIQLLPDHVQPFEFRIRRGEGAIKLRFFDTAFAENYVSLTPHAVVLCFDVADPQSFASVQDRWHPEAIAHYRLRNENVAMMLLGLKRDLRDSQAEYIDPQKAYAAAQVMRLDQYAECSAKTGKFLKESFEDIGRLVVRMCLSPGELDSGPCSIL